ncbi:signal peptidase II [Pseudoroseomonas cervicalis]|nr:signal peptidase II [Pseudoroseomonas cervicalis]
MPSAARSWAIAIVAGPLALAVDQVSKWWILTEVMDPPRLIPITGFLNLTLGYNRGVSFGLLATDSPATPILLSGLAFAILPLMGWWLAKEPRPLHGAAFGLIAGGGLGNVVDRLRQGAVTDFIDVHAAGYHWPAFNLADTAIFLGAALLIAATMRPLPAEAPAGTADRDGLAGAPRHDA